MKNHVDYIRLKAELEADFSMLTELKEKNKKAFERLKSEKDFYDEFSLSALGYTIHNIYNVLENYFFRIAKFFENNIDGDAWHKDLVFRMTIDLPGVRKKLFPADFAHKIDEFRGFRHVFRNAYTSSLDSTKTIALQQKIPALLREFKTYHTEYCSFLTQCEKDFE